MNERKSHPGNRDGQEDRGRLDVDGLTEQLFAGLNGLVPRMTIQEVLNQVVAEYASARIQTYVPIFVRRDAESRLRSMAGPRPSSDAPIAEASAGQEDSVPSDTAHEGAIRQEPRRKVGSTSMRLKPAA